MTYNPYEHIEEATATGSTYNPYEHIETTSTDPNIGMVKGGKGRPGEELVEGEAKFAAASPTGYAVTRTFLDFLPFGDYARPTARADFLKLGQTEQTQALLWNSLFAAIWGASGALPKGSLLKKVGVSGKGLGADVRYLWGKTFGKFKGKPLVPVEDAVRKVGEQAPKIGEALGGYSYLGAVGKKLRGKKFHPWEKDLLGQALISGEKEVPREMVVRMIQGRRWGGKWKPSAAMDETLEWASREGRPGMVVSDKFMEKYAERKVRGEFFQKQFEKALKGEVLGQKGGSVQGSITEAVFKYHRGKMYPEMSAKAGFGDLTTEQMGNLVLGMFERKGVTREIGKMTLFPTLQPTRFVYGLGDEVWGTRKNVGLPLTEALERTNRDFFNKIFLFAKMLEQRGAYKSVRVKATGEFVVKEASWFTNEVKQGAYKALRAMDDLTGAASRAKTKVEREELMAAAGKIGDGLGWKESALVGVWRNYSDHLYADFLKEQVPRIFEKARLTQFGREGVEAMMRGFQGLGYEIDSLLSTAGKVPPEARFKGLEEVMKRVRGKLDYAGEGVHPWFKGTPQEIANTIQLLDKQLRFGKKMGLPRYVENYAARVSEWQRGLVTGWRNQLFGTRRASFTKPRKEEVMRGEPVDFGTMVESRTMAQSKDLHLYDTIDDVVKYANDNDLPASFKQYIDTHLSGILNLPSEADAAVASFLEATVGKLERVAGKEGVWNEWRVAQVGRTLNTLTYLAALGYKPFSAVRNLFQVLLNTPADLGGLRDLGQLVGGVKRALQTETRGYLQRIGALAEYAPEIHLRPRALPFKQKIFGKEVALNQAVKDTGLWMFKGSDRWNRYVTGGAAMNKWEGLWTRMGGKRVISQQVDEFSRRLGLGKRHTWVKSEVEDLLRRGMYEDAKAHYIKDVIADTQYLYGVADAPVLLRKYGAVGRSTFIFQSWWMNYGSLLGKWARTGQSPGGKAERLFTFMLTTAVAETLMATMWGKDTAFRSTFLGPFPHKFNEFLLPPAWKPVYHVLNGIASIREPEQTSRAAKATLDSLSMFVPGSLQAKAFYRGARDEGFKGFSKAILRLE